MTDAYDLRCGFYSAFGRPCANCESCSQRAGDLFCSDECRKEYEGEE